MLHTFTFSMANNAVATIITAHNPSTRIAKTARAAWPPVKHSTVPSMYHLYIENKPILISNQT